MNQEPTLPPRIKNSEGLQGDFYDKVLKVIAYVKQHYGIDIEIASGYRSFKEQAALYAKGRTKPGAKVTNAKPGQSYHNYGLAVDLCLAEPVKEGKTLTKFPDKHDVWIYIGAAAAEYDLVWGGNFKSFKDRPHIEWNIPLATLQALHNQGGLSMVWDNIDRA